MTIVLTGERGETRVVTLTNGVLWCDGQYSRAELRIQVDRKWAVCRKRGDTIQVQCPKGVTCEKK